MEQLEGLGAVQAVVIGMDNGTGVTIPQFFVIDEILKGLEIALRNIKTDSLSKVKRALIINQISVIIFKFETVVDVSKTYSDGRVTRFVHRISHLKVL